MSFNFQSIKNNLHLSPVFVASILTLTPLLCAILFFPESSKHYLTTAHTLLIQQFGWVYSLIVGGILCTVIALAVSSFGNIKLGPDHATPSFSYLSWIAMLFSAGMGIGIMFYGVYEPSIHFLQPPSATPKTVEAAKEAMRLTFFHWGLHAWAIYAVVGLLLAFFSFRHNLPLSLRSALYPLIGEKIYGPIGHVVDVFAILGTIFGLATSLGIGVGQIGSGLKFLFDIDNTFSTQVVLILSLMALAGLSAASGLTKGLKVLSETNLYLAIFLLVCITLLGPTTFILQAFLQNTGDYLSNLVRMTFNLNVYEPPSKSNTWVADWTITYWGWWLSWSPFVGIFIARISRGRTVREFVTGVLLVPSALTFFWMTAFGNTSIASILYGSNAVLEQTIQSDYTLALFHFLGAFPFGDVLNIIAILMIVVFFVTSADSGVFVIDMLGSQRKEGEKQALWQRGFWVIVIATISIGLMSFDGTAALQKATLIASFPYAIVLSLAIFGLFKALKIDYFKKQTRKFANVAPMQSSVSWKKRIGNIVHFPDKSNVLDFLQQTVNPAMQELVNEFHKKNVEVTLEPAAKSVQLTVPLTDTEDFIYKIKITAYTKPAFVFSSIATSNIDPEDYFRAEVHLNDGGQNYDIYGYTKDQVIVDVLDQYEKHLHFLHMVENHVR